MNNIMISRRLLIVLLLLFTVISFSGFSVKAVNQLVQKDKERLFSLAIEISSKLDIKKLQSLRNPKDETGSNYLELQKILQDYQAKSNGEILYLYVIKQINNKCIYILDAVPNNDKDHSVIGDTFPINDYPRAKEGFINQSIDDYPVHDLELGVWSISMYTPIKDKTGKTIAVLGMDVKLKILMKAEA